MRLTTPVEYLKTRFVGQQTLYYPVTSSTQDVAKQAVKDGAREGTIAIADHQTAGRGRLGRKWLSSPDNSIMVSIVLYPTIEQLHQLNMVAALATAQSIERLTGLKPALKWPNDVLIEGKKVSGALVESDVQGERVGSAIVGIGLNVNLDTASLDEISATATSLREMLGKEISRPRMLECLLCEFEEVYEALRHGQPIREEWERRLDTLGRHILVKRADTVLEGYAESVNDEGNLLVRCSDGQVIAVTAGDVTLRTDSG